MKDIFDNQQKKTFIVTCYFLHNYGSMLQAYATQHFLDLNHIPNELVNMASLKEFNKRKKKYFISQLFNFDFYKAKRGMIKLKFKKKLCRKLKRNFAKRDAAFDKFKNRFFTLTKPCEYYKQITDLCNKEANNVVAGSDQLWLPGNVAADFYTLSFAPDAINKISYATSLGVSSLPKKSESNYSNFLNRINHLSVREENGKKIVESLTDKSCEVVCDPTLLLDQSEWNDIIDEKRIIEEKYIFCYLLGKAKEHRQFVEKLKQLTGYKIVSINHCDEYVKYSDKFADYTPYDVGPCEFLNLLKNAEIVCTDSFHGTSFSLIFNKKFYSFRRYTKKNSFSTNSRIDNLLNIVGLHSRIKTGLESLEEIEPDLKIDIDYMNVRSQLKPFIEKSKDYFLSSLVKEEKKTKGIVINSKQLCSGCTTCKFACPKNAIEMAADREGFLYPQVDQDKCIDCHICEHVCPVLNNKKEVAKEQKGYLVRNNDKEILQNSTSGGLFSALAKAIINKGGVVFGACFNDKYQVEHIYIEDEKDISRFRNSKYVQSFLGNTFVKVKEFLTNGRLVLFSGTPCQVESLKTYLEFCHIDMTKLYLVDIVCHSVPSPLFWEKYKKTYPDGYKPYAFRSKEKYGYEYSQICFKGENDTKKYAGIESDPYLRAFFGDLSIRPSCTSCKFKKRYRESDLTMWDCFVIHKIDKSLDDNRGVTRCLSHSKKGDELIDLSREYCLVKEFDSETITIDSKELTRSVRWNINREQFFVDVDKLEDKELFKKWFPITFKVRVARFGRHTLEALHIYRPVKRLAKRILGK